MPPSSLSTHLSLPTHPLPPLPLSQLSLLPFRLAPSASGPAPISTYFLPRSPPKASSSSLPAFLDPDDRRAGGIEGEKEGQGGDGEGRKVAAFRGRRVVSHHLALPQGYIGVLLTAPPPPSKSTEDLALRTPPKGHKRQLSTRVEVVRTGWEEGSGGLRRSPRKNAAGTGVASLLKKVEKKVVKKAVKKISLDSDSSDEGEGGEVEEEGGEGEETQQSEMVDTPMEEMEVKTDILSTAGSLAEGSGMMDVDPPTEGTQPTPQSPTPALPPTLPSTPTPSTPPPASLPPASPSTPQHIPSSTNHNIRFLIPTRTFTGFTLWAPDGPLAGGVGADEFGKALREGMRLGALVNSA